MKNNKFTYVIFAIGLLLLPMFAAQFGNAWVRIIDIALLYVLLALGLNVVVGYAGLLDLGYVAFYAVGSYLFGLLASGHLTSTFPAIAAMFPEGLHAPIWLVIPLGAAVAGLAGVMLGAPTLRCAATTSPSSRWVSVKSSACSSTTWTNRSTSPTVPKASAPSTR
jgi:branched-chain amino acid transport system permease protein